MRWTKTVKVSISQSERLDLNSRKRDNPEAWDAALDRIADIRSNPEQEDAVELIGFARRYRSEAYKNL